MLEVSHPTRRMPAEYEVRVEEGSNNFDVELPVSIIEGRITDQDGQPLPGLTVRAERAVEDESPRAFFAIRMESDGDDTVVSTGQELGDSTTTDADGRYVLRGVQSGVELVVSAEGDAVQEGQSEPIEVAPDETRRNVDLTLEPAGTLVVEALLPDGAPARSCLVQASFLGGDDSVEPEFNFMQSGTVKLPGLKPGPWNVNVRKIGPSAGDEAGVDQEVMVEAGRETETTVRLE